MSFDMPNFTDAYLHASLTRFKSVDLNTYLNDTKCDINLWKINLCTHNQS